MCPSLYYEYDEDDTHEEDTRSSAGGYGEDGA